MRLLALLLVVGCSSGARVDKCEPDFGSITGGDDMKVVGKGFGPGVSVRVGTKSARVVSVTEDSIEIKTPPSYHSGPVDVLVVNADGMALIRKSCFRYIDERARP